MKIRSYIEASPLFTLADTYQKVQKTFSETLSPHEVNFNQALLLVTLLLEKEKEVTPKILARELGLSKTLLSQTLSHLEYQKLIRRKLSNQDARSFTLHLSTLGRNKAAKLVSIFDGFQKLLESKFEAEQLSQFIQNLHLIRKLN